MVSPEIISALCAGSTKYHQPSDRSTGLNVLSGMELSALLSGLSCCAVNLALAKYAGSIEAERSLISHVRVWAVYLANSERWEVERGKPRIVNMSAIAVFEVVRPNVCGRCDGVGYAGKRLCSCCHGSGLRAISKLSIAKACDLPYETFRRKWNERYEKIFNHVQDIDCDIKTKLSRMSLKESA